MGASEVPPQIRFEGASAFGSYSLTRSATATTLGHLAAYNTTTNARTAGECTAYLGQQATPEEQKALFKNQANAFASFIEQQPSALTDHVKIIRRSSMGDVAKYLRK